MFGFFAGWVVPLFILLILVIGELKGIRVYEAFIRGAESGLKVGIKLFPFFLAVFGALAVFRSSGALNILAGLLSPPAQLLGIPPEIIPLGLLKPLSGSGALGYLAEILKNNGPDSPTGIIASVVGGSTETTFYVLTIYLGAVGITRPRHTILMGLTADLVSFCVAVLTARWLLHF